MEATIINLKDIKLSVKMTIDFSLALWWSEAAPQKMQKIVNIKGDPV